MADRFPPGTIFWLDSGQGVGQEERGRHLWVVLSDHRVERKAKLVLAVPLTSNQLAYNDFQLTVLQSDVELLQDLAEHDKPKDILQSTVKCEKARHWSVDREGIVIVGRLTERSKMATIRRTVGEAFAIPARKRG